MKRDSLKLLFILFAIPFIPTHLLCWRIALVVAITLLSVLAPAVIYCWLSNRNG